MKKIVISFMILALLLIGDLASAEESASLIYGMKANSYRADGTLESRNIDKTEFTDGDTTTYADMYSGGGYIDFVLPHVADITGLAHIMNNPLTVQFYDENDTLIKSQSINSSYGNVVSVNVKNVKKIRYKTQNLATRVYELWVFGDYKIPPQQVSQVIARPLSDKEIEIRWQIPNDPNYLAAELYMNGNKIANIQSPESSYTVKNLTANTEYEFSLVSLSPQNLKSEPVTFFATTLDRDQTPPAEIRNLQSVVKDTWIRFTWENPDDADFYEVRIYRNGQLVGIAHTQINYFIDIGLSPHTTYTFVFRSIDTNGNMSAGVSITETTRGAPRGKVNLYGNAWENSVELIWTSSKEAEEYHIYQDGVKVAETDKTTKEINGLTNGQSYSFYVIPVNEFGDGEKSNTITLTPTEIPIPDPPFNVSYTAYNNSIQLHWTNVQYARKYNIYAEIDDEVTLINTIFFDVAHAAGDKKIGETTDTTFTITELTEGTSYTYYVSAENEKGESAKTKVIVKTVSQPIPRDMKLDIKPWDVIYNTIVLIGSLGSIILLALVIAFAPRIIQIIKQAAS